VIKQKYGEIGSEKWIDPFILAGKQIKMASKVKILCQILSNEYKDIEHVSKRK